MKLKDTRGIKLNGEYTKFIHGPCHVIDEKGNETIVGVPITMYIPTELTEQFIALSKELIILETGRVTEV